MEPPTIPEAPTPEIIKIDRPTKRRYIPRLFGWLFAGLVGFVFLGLILPVSNRTGIRGTQTQSLARAKQVALALKLFAGDHEGDYPRQGFPPEMTTAPTDSNTAFACLFPTYTQSENIFGNPQSAYQTATPDNVIDTPYTGKPKETLQPGENVWSYVMGLNDRADNPSTPLVMDGTDGHGHYRIDPKQRGGVWKGSRAIVIRLDCSGAVETLTGPDDARFIPLDHEHPASNLLDFSRLAKPGTLLDPAVGPRRK